VPTLPTPPPSTYPFGMGIPFSHALRRLLFKHHLMMLINEITPRELLNAKFFKVSTVQRRYAICFLLLSANVPCQFWVGLDSYE
jgi:hypothetical protein